VRLPSPTPAKCRSALSGKGQGVFERLAHRVVCWRVKPNELFPPLTEALHAAREEVRRRWVDAVRRGVDIPAARRLDDRELSDHLPQLFENLAAYLLSQGDADSRQRAVQAARAHGGLRGEQGYGLEELLRELELVRRAVLGGPVAAFIRERGLAPSEAERVQELVGRFFEDCTAASAGRFIEEWRTRLEAVDASRRQLLCAVTHELGNFVRGLTLVLSALTPEVEGSEPRRMLALCTRQLADMSALVEELREYGVLLAGEVRPEPQRLEVAPFAEEIAAAHRPLAQARGLELRLRVDSRLGSVEVDPRRLRQILGNLLTNAVKYRDRAKPACWVELAFEAAGAGRWRVRVKDNGIGIAPADQARIFEEFQRLSPREEVHGTGLGLAIARRLTELLGGEIRVRSQVGRGSRFELELPVVARRPSA
jgi:signal transduction histidine kinase